MDSLELNDGDVVTRAERDEIIRLISGTRGLIADTREMLQVISDIREEIEDLKQHAAALRDTELKDPSPEPVDLHAARAARVPARDDRFRDSGQRE